MDSTLLLFDYITEVQQSKVESNFHDIKDICDELERGLNAFYNSEIVMEYYNKYGATEHFEMLIGNEELIDTVKDALASFIRWVKRKLIQLSSFLFQLVKSVVDVIASLVWMVFHVKEYTVGIDCPYNLHDLITVFSSLFVESRKSTNYRILDDQSIIAVVQSKLSELYTGLKDDIVKAKTVVKYNRSEFKKRSVEFETLLNNAYTTEVDTLAHCIESFSKGLNENITSKQYISLRETLMTRLSYVHNIFIKYSLKYDGTDENVEVSLLKRDLRLIVGICTAFSEFYSKGLRKGVSILKELHDAYNKGQASIHIEVPVDQSMITRLSEYFGEPIKVTKVVFTSMAPSTWNRGIGISGTVGGWCYPGALGPGRSFPTELWINTRAVFSWMKRFETTWMISGGSINIYDYFLKIFIHECKHLCDIQNGRDLNTKIPDLFSPHERRARKAAARFEIKDSDRAWARKTIDTVKFEIEKQSKQK